MKELVVTIRGKVDKLKQDVQSAFKNIAPSPIKKMSKEGTSLLGEGIGLKMIGKLAGIFGIVMMIAKAIMSLKPIQAIMEMINKILQMFFLPFAMMLFRLLKPALVWLLKLMMMWIRFWKDPIGNLKKIGEAIVNGLSGIFSGIGEAVGGFKDWVIEGAESIWNGIIDIAKNTGKVLAGLGKWIWDAIVNYISLGLKILSTFGKWIWDTITGLVKLEINIIQSFGKWLWGLITKSVSSNVSILKSFGKWIWDKLSKIFGDSFKTLVDLGTSIFSWIEGKIVSGLDVLKDLGKKILDWIWSKVTNAGKVLKNAFTPKKEESERPGNTEPITIRDAIITPTGQIIQTSPQDYLIATKTPTGGNTFNIHITLNREEENIARQITRALTHELSRYGRW